MADSADGHPTDSDAEGPVVTDINEIDPHSFQALAARLPEGRAPNLDGRLDDEVWLLAPAQGPFVQRDPNFGWLSTERTEFRILYDDRTLYFGVWCFDSEAHLIQASQMLRDWPMTKGDEIRIAIDTFHDHRNAFYFTTNPFGAFKDANAVEEGRVINLDWNAVWESEASVDDEGWYVEIAIPLSQLRFKGGLGETTWGLNVGRIIRRKNEDSYWVPFPREWRTLGIYRMSSAGVITGLKDVEPRRRMEFLPYVAPLAVRDYDAGTPTETTAGYGFDFKIGLTSTFNADVTYKTDFAQVEADQEVVNLSRFSLFFPEKRQFFTETAGLFEYGRTGTGFLGRDLLRLYYSRTIGQDEGREVPILAGGRVTGRSGAYTVGVMNVETEETTLDDGDTERVVPRANYTVVRVKRDVLSQSSIGGIVLNREGGSGTEYNRTVGVDGLFSFGQNLMMMLLAAKTFTPDTSGKDSAAAVDVAWTSDRWAHAFTYLDIAERFDAQMGFIPRTDIRNARVSAEWTPRPNWKGVRQLRIGGNMSYFENHDGRVESRNQQLQFRVDGNDTSRLELFVNRDYEYVPYDWYTGGGVIPTGGYDWDTFRVRYRSNRSRAVSGSLTVDLGGYYNGDKQSYRGTLDLLSLRTLLVETSYTHNRISLPDTGLYTTNVVSTRVSYSFSPELYLKSYIQYNDARRLASLNVLFWFIYRPGSDLYIVYDQGWETGLSGPQSMRPRKKSLAIKMTYWLSR